MASCIIQDLADNPAIQYSAKFWWGFGESIASEFDKKKVGEFTIAS